MANIIAFAKKYWMPLAVVAGVVIYFVTNKFGSKKSFKKRY